MNPNEHQLQYPFADTQPGPGRALEVAEGVKWIRMPLPFALDHINLWLLRDEIDGRHATRSLQAGITFAVRSGDLPKDLPVEATTQLLSSAFDRAALAIEAGGDAAAYASALVNLIDGLAALRRPQE